MTLIKVFLLISVLKLGAVPAETDRLGKATSFGPFVSIEGCEEAKTHAEVIWTEREFLCIKILAKHLEMNND